jgi:peptide/nickel transport system ATP-binding protein
MPILNVKNLEIGYSDSNAKFHIAVNGINFSVNKGETIGIVGESGCGKSTVARALMGYLRPGGKIIGGEVSLSGISVLDKSAEALQSIRGRTVAIVPQNPLSSLTYHITVGKQVNEILRTHRGMTTIEAHDESLRLFRDTLLPEPKAIYDRYPHQISGGQRQRIVIAAALACKPALMILDEPTTALDTTTEMQILRLVKELRQEIDTAIVYITHDLTLTNYMCDRVLVMHNGSVVEEGTAEAIFYRPKEFHTQHLVAAIPRIDQPSKRKKIAERNLGERILEVENLSFSYTSPWSLPNLFGRKPLAKAINDVSFAVRQKETLGLVGESGSGKSTAANIIAGLSKANSGAMRFDGEDLNLRGGKRSKETRRRIQLIFQDPLSSLNPRHKIGTILARSIMSFIGLNRSQALDRAVELLSEMELPTEVLNRYPRQLSGGQQQRVAVARAFSADPDLILCDEITSALDVSVQAHVLDLLMALQLKKGTACIFISHDLGVIREVAHRTVVMRNGIIEEEGLTEDLFSNSKNRYTRHLISAARRSDFDFQDQKGGPEPKEIV